MKLIPLRYLVAVAENDLNITQAARVLHAAQPGVSKQLEQLEDEFGFQLHERKGRALVRPTDAGTKVIDRASRIVRPAPGAQQQGAGRGDPQGRCRRPIYRHRAHPGAIRVAAGAQTLS